MADLRAEWKQREDTRYLEAHAGNGPAHAAVILLHGRGSNAPDIMSLARLLDAGDVLFLAPEAPRNTWYPFSFLAPLAQNEPSLSAALVHVGRMLDLAVDTVGSAERVILAGFSQGACLALESAVRRPQVYGGVVAFSGGLIGPPGTVWNAEGDFAGTPIFLGCSDIDPHIPLARVEESTVHLKGMGAAVTQRIYPGMGHTINDEELDTFRQILSAIG